MGIFFGDENDFNLFGGNLGVWGRWWDILLALWSGNTLCKVLLEPYKVQGIELGSDQPHTK